jgi:hypothetical protein
MPSVQQSYQAFQKNLVYWQTELARYTEADLAQTIDGQSWTLGQLYNHLIGSTLYFQLPEVTRCLESSKNRYRLKNIKGMWCFYYFKGFPPMKIYVPASDSYTPKQPSSKASLERDLQRIAEEMTEILPAFDQNLKGKSKHPGLGFCNAKEWYLMVEMHWRHHLRQKAEFDSKLESN